MSVMAVKPIQSGGRHLMGVCNAAYAEKHFPRRHWEMGSRSLSLAEFAWDEKDRRMLYTACAFKYGQALTKPQDQKSVSCMRLYTIDEVEQILGARGMQAQGTYGGYETSPPASEDRLALVVHSQKVSR
jgi:hypothetical protein